MSTDLGSESSEKFHCIICDYYTSRKSQLVRHNLTDKHKNQQLSTFVNEKVPESSNTFTCDCGKNYKDKSGLWRHKKQCTYQDSKMETTNVAHSDEINELKEFMKYLMQENSEMKNMMMEVIKNGTNTNSHNTISTNSHNKAAL